jgi:hypothetical protein
MYQPYLGGSQIPGKPRPQAPPPSIGNACRMMYLGAAASLGGIGVDLATFPLVANMLRRQSPKLAPARLAHAEHADIALLIAAGLAQAALWLWLTRPARAGKGWARVVSTVLFGVATLGELIGPSYTPGDPARIYGMVVWLIGLAAMYLLWQRTSTEFFRGSRDCR